MTIGFIGLGAFGERIACRLADEGVGLMIHDRITDAVRYFMLRNSADVAEGPRTIAALCDVVVCVLPGPAEVREIAFGRLGLVEGLPDGKRLVLIDLGTSSSAEATALAAELAPRGIAYVEAPAWGSPADGRRGALVVPYGCEDADVAAVEPVLRAIAANHSRTGRAGSAHIMGPLVEQMRAAALLAAAEALALGDAAGVSPEVFLAWTEHAGLLAPNVARMLRDHALNAGAAPSGHRMATVTHNLDLARALAAKTGLKLPQLDVIARQWNAARAARGDEADHADIVRATLEASRRDGNPPAA